MTAIFKITDAIWTGETRALNDNEVGVPAGWTDTPPPAFGTDEVAYFIGGDWIVGPPRPEPLPAAPDEVAIHRVKKAALLTPWPGATNLLEAIYAALDQLPAPSNQLGRIEFDSAPNLVREGLTTQAVCQILGMTAPQLDELLMFAASLP